MRRKQYQRHYVQYNDLVFEGYDMIEEEDSEVSFKSNSTSYTFRHGSYSPQKQKGVLAESGSVSMTMTFHMRDIPCQYRPYYISYIIGQLSEQGKLWAVQNNTLLWAYAELTSYTSHTSVPKDTFRIDVEFFLPEGIWHKADKLKTFVLPYSICDFVECLHLHDASPCESFEDGVCCVCATHDSNKKESCGCCNCSDLTKDMALCYFNDYESFYGCKARYRIVYDCSAAQKLFFPDFYSHTYLGQKFCANCAPIAGILYSDTDIPTTGIKITLHGDLEDPYIEINGNGNTIKGTYKDGSLEIYPNGSVYYIKDGCVRCDPLPVSAWTIPSGMHYGWQVNNGSNRVVIQSGNCCGTVCAYIEVDALTY